MQYTTDIGQSVTEVAMNLAHYVFEDAEAFEEGELFEEWEVLTEENWYEYMIDIYERHAYHAVDLMSPSEVDRLVAEYGIQKAIDLFCDDDSIQYITVKYMLVAILRRQLRDLITWTYYQMWKDNGGRISY
jgi:hypothetical protein